MLYTHGSQPQDYHSCQVRKVRYGTVRKHTSILRTLKIWR